MDTVAGPSPAVPARFDIAYRVTGIPRAWTEADLVTALATQAEMPGIRVRSIALEAHGRWQVATISASQPIARLADLGMTDSLDLTLGDAAPSQGPSATIVNLSIDRHFHGLTTLQRPAPQHHKVDIVVIHGIGGHAFGSFKAKGSDFMWLRDALPSDLSDGDHPTARIITYGYESAIAGSRSFQNLEDLGIRLQTALSTVPKAPQPKPIIVIAHSFGGLVVKQALMFLSQAANEEYVRVFNCVYGVAFFGVPHDGMDVTSLVSMAEDGPNRALVESISNINSQVSSIQQREFPRAFSKRGKSEVFCFYETRESPTAAKDAEGVWRMNGSPTVLVTKASATNSRHWEDTPEHICAIDRTHSEMVKFGRNDVAYEEVLPRLKTLVARALRLGGTLSAADSWIRRECYTPEKLEIKRLSGDHLPMDQCYINLVMIEKQAKSTSEVDEFASLRERSELRDPPNREGIWDLPQLFSPGKGEAQAVGGPRRIMIHGRPGVGKTTLCKKVVHDFLWQGLWAELFERILWVPLRNLRRHVGGGHFDLPRLFHSKYFSQSFDGSELSEVLLQSCAEMKFSSTLFLLDGLDEIWLDLSPEDPVYTFLMTLMRQPNVITTSRPSIGSLPEIRAFDLSLDAIGFNLDQQKTYIERIQPDASKDILHFLESRPLLQDMVRIPIQLDALCFVWEEFPDDPPETMTELYHAIEKKLWQKNIKNLGKRLAGTSSQSIDLLLDTEIDTLIGQESLVLESLAMAGMHHRTAVFSSRFRTQIASTLDLVIPGGDQTLKKLSFVRTSDASKRAEETTYYFLHLTVQEYFAAKFFVRHWRNNNTLTIPSPGRTTEAPLRMSPHNFFRKHKYMRRYNVVWRFVAGLMSLDASDKSKHRAGFFDLMNQEPHDILEPADLRLMMRCLNEIRSSDTFPERRKIEMILRDWVEFQCGPYSHQVPDSFRPPIFDIEFPEHILVHVLMEWNGELRHNLTTHVLHRDSRAGTQIAAYLAEILAKGDETSHILDLLSLATAASFADFYPRYGIYQSIQKPRSGNQRLKSYRKFNYLSYQTIVSWHWAP